MLQEGLPKSEFVYFSFRERPACKVRSSILTVRDTVPIRYKYRYEYASYGDYYPKRTCEKRQESGTMN